FSSRRRHTRSKRDWSSDVCSSDLVIDSIFSICSFAFPNFVSVVLTVYVTIGTTSAFNSISLSSCGNTSLYVQCEAVIPNPIRFRSEERRVGKEGRSWWAPDDWRE